MLDSKTTELGHSIISQGPAWNNQSEYPSLTANEFAHDLDTFAKITEQIRLAVTQIQPQINIEPTAQLIAELQKISELKEAAYSLIRNLITYASCESDVDSSNDEATKIKTGLGAKGKILAAELKAVENCLDNLSEEALALYLQHPHTASEEFALRRSRLLKETKLSVAEEKLLTQFSTHGPTAWGDLYSQISGALRCNVEIAPGKFKEMGLAEASGLVRGEDEGLRKTAWLAIQAAWKTQEISIAAVLNSLAGWRLETYKQRSRKRPFTFLDEPVHRANMSRATLDAMMNAVEGAKPVAQRAMQAMAKASGKAKLEPWDLLASAPSTEGKRGYKEGLGMIRDAVHAIDPSLGDFIDTMEKNRWIEGRVLPYKRQGAYCADFAKSRTPRVFQTYQGTLSDIRTLAHELGHAYHAWMMRDMPRPLCSYPMTLAETASIFFETAFADHISRQTENPAQAFEIDWQNAESAASFLLNIPARFEFEKNFYARREQSPYVSAEELNELTAAAWNKWYGDTLTMPERQFWMSKLHFSISSVSFYNFPYTFGYLFSLSLFARRETLGREFLPRYIALLRDTGRMTVEELVRKHLDEDIRDEKFWTTALNVVENDVQRLEKRLK